MQEKPSRFGRCSLTEKEGRFVKSHILPRALTKPEINGERLLQIEAGREVTVRRDSWYDTQLVIAEGEKVLRDLDDFGISELRRLNLVWSSQYPIGKLSLPVGQKTSHAPGEIVVQTKDSGTLRRFFASIFWRCAASSLRDMEDATLPPDLIERLRREVNGECSPDPFYLPIHLMHYCTTGPRHNLSPFWRFFEGPALRNRYLRLEMDGLVLLMFPTTSRHQVPFADWNTVAGNSRELIFISRPFEKSFGEENLRATIIQHSTRR